MDPIYFVSPAEWRAWLEANHDKASELLVGFYKKGTGRPTITWPESVDEALCFGWIDGIRKTVDADRYTIRFTPRKRGSTWSAVNLARVAELTAQGRMHPAGLKAFAVRDPAKAEQYSYERATATLGDEYESEFRAHADAWAYFQAQGAYYQRAATWWVISAKRDDTRRTRLATLIETSARGERLPHLTYTRKG